MQSGHLPCAPKAAGKRIAPPDWNRSSGGANQFPGGGFHWLKTSAFHGALLQQQSGLSLPESFFCACKQGRHRGVPTLPIVTTRCRDQVQTHPALTQLAGEPFIHTEQHVVIPT